MSCGVGHRCSWDSWHRLAAVTLIQPLAWELPYATNAAIKSKKKKKIRIKHLLKRKKKHLKALESCQGRKIWEGQYIKEK